MHFGETRVDQRSIRERILKRQLRMRRNSIRDSESQCGVSVEHEFANTSPGKPSRGQIFSASYEVALQFSAEASQALGTHGETWVSEASMELSRRNEEVLHLQLDLQCQAAQAAN